LAACGEHQFVPDVAVQILQGVSEELGKDLWM